MDQFKGKNILVFGLGLNKGGVGSALFFAKAGSQVRVTDLKTEEVLKSSLDQLKDFPNISYTLGTHKNEDIDWADLIIKNPAVKPGNPFVEYAQSQGKRVEMDMGIFLNYVSPNQIIGITGSKGKSTTSSLVYEILKAAGKKVIFAGNIGKSVLDTIDLVTDDTLVVLEISSFQLESFEEHKVSPRWAVITNIYPDHLNYYKGMDVYIQAKKIIAKYQTEEGFLYLRKGDPITTSPKFLEGIKSKLNYFEASDLAKNFQPKLLGHHNLENIAAAFSLGKTFNINGKLLLQTLSNFTGVEFRLQLVRVVDGIRIYNDTTATTPDATIQALKTLSSLRTDGDLILIAGGMNKNMPYEELAKAIDEYSSSVFLLPGDATDEIKQRLSEKKIKGTFDNIENLLIAIKRYIKKGDIVLFSPGATSFNMFQNEFDRGRQFNLAVEKVFK